MIESECTVFSRPKAKHSFTIHVAGSMGVSSQGNNQFSLEGSKVFPVQLFTMYIIGEISRPRDG